MNHSIQQNEAASLSSRHPQGAFVLSLWIPFDIWPRIAAHLHAMPDLKSFQNVCRASSFAVALLQAPRRRVVCAAFHTVKFAIPPSLLDNVLMVHAVPPRADSLILFVDNESTSGVDLAWLRDGVVKRVSLGLDSVPASTVSNIRFSPDGKRIALLVTLAHGTLVHEDLDPLHRLRGWETVTTSAGHVCDITHDPCEDCTVQVIDLETDDAGMPDDLIVHTFSHVFVPEYGFDMVWRYREPYHCELAFAALLHSSAGAATYLVRWCSFDRPGSSNFVFMACIDGASEELLHDKRRAMLAYDSTRCTSRIELSDDASYIFFDTISKFGVLRFDQVDDANTARVIRADLPNNPRDLPTESPRASPTTSSGKEPANSQEIGPCCRALRELNVGNPAESRSPSKCSEDVTRVSRMSPDGSLLCSVLGVGPKTPSRSKYTRHIEMRCSISGRLLYRRTIVKPRLTAPRVRVRRFPFEKSGDVAQHSFGFSSDSALVILWDTHLTSTQVSVFKRLPLVIQARSGRVIQDFHRLQAYRTYEQAQMAPDGLTLYGTRMCDEKIAMDAIDVLSGIVLKTLSIGETTVSPRQCSAYCIYMLPDDTLLTVSRGQVDALWETSRGSLGCGWRADLRPTRNDSEMVDQENRSP